LLAIRLLFVLLLTIRLLAIRLLTVRLLTVLLLTMSVTYILGSLGKEAHGGLCCDQYEDLLGRCSTRVGYCVSQVVVFVESSRGIVRVCCGVNEVVAIEWTS